MKPIIFYVDDEPHNLTVFEAALPSEWEIRTFSNPFEALQALETVSPWVIVSDQRMPGITGVKYLELARKLHPHAVRIIVTGYSEENLVIDSVRTAQIFDYITKPWEIDHLEAGLRRAIEYYKVNEQARKLHEQLVQNEARLTVQNAELTKMTEELKAANERELTMRKELECWVPRFVLWALKENGIQFPITKDLVGITFDVVDSNEIHGKMVQGRSLRSLVLQSFSELILRNGGWRESHAGDSAYGHFGLIDNKVNPYEAALATAREFRVALRGLSEMHAVKIECGIALHAVKNARIEVHNVQITSSEGTLTQKSFDTTSADVDFLHRMEKLVHVLPGTNIILSQEFVSQVKSLPNNLVNLGAHLLKGASTPIQLHLIPSDRVQPKDLETLKTSLSGNQSPTDMPKAA